MNLFKYLFITFTSLTFVSCNNDLDVIAEWKETTIVYGLLDQSQTTQYIRINKAFLGEGNALQMAQVYDSIQYGNQLTVKLERIKNGSVIESTILKRDSSIVKNSGLFSYPNQVLFKTISTYSLFTDCEYGLSIINNSTGKIITSKTKLISDFTIEKPFQSQPSISFYPSCKLEWRTSVNGRLYDAILRFHYSEEDLTTSITTPKSADMYIGSLKSSNLAGGETMVLEFTANDFFNFLRNNLTVDPNLKRYVGNVDLLFSAAADEFNTYIEINAPSTGVAQEKPEYTNIENGLGIFSARYNKSISKPLTLSTIDSLLAKSQLYGWGF